MTSKIQYKGNSKEKEDRNGQGGGYGQDQERSITAQTRRSCNPKVFRGGQIKDVKSKIAHQISAQNATQRSVDILQRTSTASSGLVPLHIVIE